MGPHGTYWTDRTKWILELFYSKLYKCVHCPAVSLLVLPMKLIGEATFPTGSDDVIRIAIYECICYCKKSDRGIGNPIAMDTHYHKSIRFIRSVRYLR